MGRLPSDELTVIVPSVLRLCFQLPGSLLFIPTLQGATRVGTPVYLLDAIELETRP